MKIVHAWEEQGVMVPAPYEREIKLLLGPDKGDVEEIRFNLVTLPEGGQTTYHEHDRPELIFVIEGQGICVYEKTEISIVKDTLIWAEKGDPHQIRNVLPTPLRLATLFVPGFTSDKALYNQELQGKE